MQAAVPFHGDFALPPASARLCSADCAGLPLGGILCLPMPSDGAGGLVQPTWVAAQFLDYAGGEVFSCVGGGFSQWLEQLGRDQHGDVVRLEAQDGCGLVCIQSGWQTSQE